MKLTIKNLKIAVKILYEVDIEAFTFYYNLFLYLKNEKNNSKAEEIYSHRKGFICGYYLPDEICYMKKEFERKFHK
jgi:hypothetical protein